MNEMESVTRRHSHESPAELPRDGETPGELEAPDFFDGWRGLVKEPPPQDENRPHSSPPEQRLVLPDDSGDTRDGIAPDGPEGFDPFEPDPLDEPRGRFRSRRLVTWIALAAAGLVVVALYGLTGGRTEDSEGTFEVQRGLVHRVVAGEGRIEPYAEVRLSASMLGRIDSIFVDEGDVVEEGQVLALMEDDELRARLLQATGRLEEARARYAEIQAGPRGQELEAARAREREARAVLEEASAAFDRSGALYERGMIPRAQLDEAERRRRVALAQQQIAVEELSLTEMGPREEVRQASLALVQTAEADVAHARALLEQTTIRAPVSGQVVRKYMQPGEVIVMQRPQPVLTLADLSRIQVRAEIDETDARFIAVGQPVVVTSDAYPGREFEGTVVDIGTTVGRKSVMSEDPAAMLDARVVEVIVAVDEAHPWTFGVTVQVSLTVARRDDVLVVPRSAVLEDGSAVMVRRGSSYERQSIRVGADDSAYIEVVSGLKEGDVVLLP